jgi:CheY-like chemotaxis protein
MAEILVVDDDPDFCEITRTILEGAGHKVRTASNGDQAWACMSAQLPELVVLDVMMTSVLDGLNVSDRMARDIRLKKVPIIMVSSIAGSQYAGMFPTDTYLPVDAWLSKPVAPQALLSRINELLAR